MELLQEMDSVTDLILSFSQMRKLGGQGFMDLSDTMLKSPALGVADIQMYLRWARSD